jgi:hypothetical protein
METALYSPANGFNRSAIMGRALASARESRDWQKQFATTPKGIKRDFQPQSWAFLISHALKAAWTFARAERAQTMASLATDGRLAA